MAATAQFGMTTAYTSSYLIKIFFPFPIDAFLGIVNPTVLEVVDSTLFRLRKRRCNACFMVVKDNFPFIQ